MFVTLDGHRPTRRAQKISFLSGTGSRGRGQEEEEEKVEKEEDEEDDEVQKEEEDALRRSVPDR